MAVVGHKKMQRITLEDIAEMRRRGYDRSTIADAEAWLEICNQADVIIVQIDKAFEGVSLDEGIGLWESGGIDDYCGPEELQRVRADDEKSDWRLIPEESLNRCNAAPSFLDAKGLHFHTPAFLTAELKGQYAYDFIASLIDGYSMTPGFIELLTASQRDAIIACIKLYGSIKHYGYDPRKITRAINRFTASGGVEQTAVPKPDLHDFLE